MNVKIKLIDKSLPIPQYQTKGAVAFDFYSRVNIKIPKKSTKIIPLNVVAKVPKNTMLLLAGRSSLPKKGLMVANSIGIIDQDYCGENDEICLFVYNFSNKTAQVNKGERIAQGIFVHISKVSKFIPVNVQNTKSRGGFGSTGK